MLNKIITFEFLGRILFTTTFLIAIPPKVLKFQLVVNAIVYRGISPSIAPYLLVSAIICLLFGSLLFLYGQSRLGSALLLIFLVPTTAIFHIIPFDSQSFFMNLGLIGALIIFLTKLDINQINDENEIYLYRILRRALKYLKIELLKLVK